MKLIDADKLLEKLGGRRETDWEMGDMRWNNQALGHNELLHKVTKIVKELLKESEEK